MLSAFQIFKIILGIVLSVFVLVMAMQFSNTYMNIGESGKTTALLVNLRKSIDDVYTTGVPSDFRIRNVNKVIRFYRPPDIITSVTNVNVDPITTFFIPSDDFSITREEYDAGWWKFQFVEMLPDMKIIFIPLTENVDKWSIVGNITQYLPSTENTKNKVRFGVGCNGSSFWFGWEKTDFMEKYLKYFRINKYVLNMCGNLSLMKKKGYRYIIITDGDETGDFIVKPKNEHIGFVYIRKGNETESYVYKNALDIVSLFLGGKQFYDYENRKFIHDLKVAIDINEREINLLSKNEKMRDCRKYFSIFSSALNDLKDFLGKMNYENEDDVNAFNEYMFRVEKAYNDLEDMGCE